MKRKANPTIIGAFIFGALILVIAGVLFWWPSIGEDRERYQLFFAGSVKGLRVGAPVLVKGVRVGRVRDISLRMDTGSDRQLEYMVPVVVELSRHQLLAYVQGDHISPEQDAGIAELIEKGLRAQLELDSIVTQQLFVELGFHPDTEPVFHSHRLKSEFEEIPTIQTRWQELQANLGEIDLTQMVAKASSALDSINNILNAPELMQSVIALEKTLANTNVLVTGLNEDRKIIDESVRTTLLEARKTFTDTRELVQQMHATMDEVDQLVANLDTLTDGDSPTIYRLDTALDEVSETARATRRLVEMLERRPEALIRGIE